MNRALKGRDKLLRYAATVRNWLRRAYAAPSRLVRSDHANPRVSPWALLLRPVGATLLRRTVAAKSHAGGVVSIVDSNHSWLVVPNRLGANQTCVEQRG